MRLDGGAMPTAVSERGGLARSRCAAKPSKPTTMKVAISAGGCGRLTRSPASRLRDSGSHFEQQPRTARSKAKAIHHAPALRLTSSPEARASGAASQSHRAEADRALDEHVAHFRSLLRFQREHRNARMLAASASHASLHWPDIFDSDDTFSPCLHHSALPHHDPSPASFPRAVFASSTHSCPISTRAQQFAVFYFSFYSAVLLSIGLAKYVENDLAVVALAL